MARLSQCLFAGIAALATVANAATVTLDWNITWVRANPDGLAARPVIGINGQWPLPLLNFTKGDRVIANVHNQVRPYSICTHMHSTDIH